MKPEIERRRAYRVPVSNTSELTAQAWHVGSAPLSRRPLPSQELVFQVREVNEIGLTILLNPSTALGRSAGAQERVRVELRFGEHSALLEGYLRFPPGGVTANAALQAGVRFGGGTDPRSRVSLARIAASVQRESARHRVLYANESTRS